MQKELVDKTIKAIELISDKLYKGYTNEGIAELGNIVPDISIICDSIKDIELKNKILLEVLMPIMNAMEKKEGIEIADLIHYELISILKQLV